ncbi:hypothetical protein [Pseudomonas sp. QTF5]|uniref:hypothetical protein n=1 Tax=Pseudomonas sp. QTF5 TaxID=1435425 RepID=UPI0004B31A3E|nr:hypothetical protein [Pseudomonas sp. QTF5]
MLANLYYPPVVPTDGANVINGNPDDDSLLGLGGDDTLYGNGGNDMLDGGSGNDRMAHGRPSCNAGGREKPSALRPNVTRC